MSDYVIEGDCPKHSHRNGPGYECAACQVERLEKENQALRKMLQLSSKEQGFDVLNFDKLLPGED